MRGTPRSLRAQVQLDGLRGLAIASVLAMHIVFLGEGSHGLELPGGFLGVDIFVVLSAFLISSVLLREIDRWREDEQGENQGTRHAVNPVDLAGFTRRRARRLYPPLLVFLAIEAPIAVILGTPVGTQIRQMILAVTYTFNWQQVWGSQAPFALDHLWSLALEVQFYVLLALGFAWAARRIRSGQVAVWLMMAGALVVALWRAHLFDAGVPLEELYQRTDTRLDLMFMGVVAALVYRMELLSDQLMRYLGALGLAFLAVAVVVAEPGSSWLYLGGFSSVATASAVMVAGASTGSGLVAFVGGLRPLRWLGTISYSLYLWHLPIYLWVARALSGQPVGVRIVVAIPAAIAVGWISFQVVEARFLASWRRSVQSEQITSAPVDRSA